MPLDDRTSLREVINNFSAVVLTGGSSGIGKSFIKLMQNVLRDLSVCNLSRRSPDMFSEELNLRHAPCDFCRRGRSNSGVKGVLSILNREVPEGRVLLINTSGYGSYWSLLETDLGKELGIIKANLRAVVEGAARHLTTMTARGCAVLKRASPLSFQPEFFIVTGGATQTFELNRSPGLREESKGTGVHRQNVCSGPTEIGAGIRAGSSAMGASGELRQTPDPVVSISLRVLATPRRAIARGWRTDLIEACASWLPERFASTLAAQVVARAEPLEVAQ